MTESFKQCRSQSPEIAYNLKRLQCIKPRGHKSYKHSNPLAKLNWEGGIKTNPSWIHPYNPEAETSEADFALRSRHGI